MHKLNSYNSSNSSSNNSIASMDLISSQSNYNLNNINNFNCIENKHLLWQLLYENNVFINIPDKQINNVKKIFEDKINFINSNENTCTLTEKNKKLKRF